MPGIKVDAGTKPLPFASGELVTEGLDGLRERFAEYRELGARFSKWRAVITIGAGIPSDYCIATNAHALGRFAALSQEAGIVPIVEPEVLMDGDHTIDACFDATRKTLLRVFEELAAQRVAFEGMLLKPNMVLSATSAPNRAPAEEVARLSVTCYRDTVPAAVPGIVFLSGGQGDDEAVRNLDAINRYAASTGGAPWQLSFSFGRALQAAPQAAWSGKAENVAGAQAAFLQRAVLSSAAREGRYSAEMDKQPAGAR